MGLFDSKDSQGQEDKGWLAGLGDLIKEGAGIFADVRDIFKDEPQIVPNHLASKAPYDPNIKFADYFKFSPNWYLLAFGVVLLGIAFVIGRSR
jgi:hypothetical protein